MKYNTFYAKSIFIVKLYLITIFIFMLFRSILFFSFVELENNQYILKAFSNGFKFDTIVFTYMSLLLFILAIPLLFFNPNSHYNRFYSKFSFYYSFTVLFVVFFILMVDYYYYQFYNNHFDDVVFGIVEDDTKAVLASVWSDYPILKISLIFIGFFILLRFVLLKIYDKPINFPFKNPIIKIVYVLFFLGLLGLGMRGSVGTFPIGKDDMIICENKSINDITPNAIFYMKETIADRAKYSFSTEIAPLLFKYKFTTAEEALTIFTHNPSAGNYQELMAKTSDNEFLKANPPNIVFILMESMSNHFLNFHSKEFNLLGELENQMEYGILYRNFMPCGNGTIHSFEGIIANNPTTPISQSAYSNKSLKSSIALPFKQNSYSTIFITGAKLGWRNLGPWASNQYFDLIEGNNTLLSEVEDAKESTWGVFDEFLFERIFDKLKKSSNEKKPIFIFGFTTSNHTPYDIPESYKPLPLNFSDSLKSILKADEKISYKNFRNYQYVNHNLGKLIKRIRESEFGNNTIIAVSGDHNCRQVFEFSGEELFDQYSVPFIIFVPEKYQRNIEIDPNRFGSHKDIFPTLINLSLSDTRYFNSGNNLLTTEKETYFYAVNSYNLGFDKYGAVSANNNLRYQWKPDSRLLEQAADNSKFDSLYNEIRAHSFCLDYFVRESILNEKP